MSPVPERAEQPHDVDEAQQPESARSLAPHQSQCARGVVGKAQPRRTLAQRNAERSTNAK